jgi:Bardet-Biedl syndrome 2 protein
VQVCIKTDDMDLAGDILQELCTFLNITDLASTAEFPDEFENLGEVLNQVS